MREPTEDLDDTTCNTRVPTNVKKVEDRDKEKKGEDLQQPLADVNWSSRHLAAVKR